MNIYKHDLTYGDTVEILVDQKDSAGRVRAKKGTKAIVERLSPSAWGSDIIMHGYVSVRPQGKNKNIIIFHNKLKKL